MAVQSAHINWEYSIFVYFSSASTIYGVHSQPWPGCWSQSAILICFSPTTNARKGRKNWCCYCVEKPLNNFYSRFTTMIVCFPPSLRFPAGEKMKKMIAQEIQSTPPAGENGKRTYRERVRRKFMRVLSFLSLFQTNIKDQGRGREK